jgi:hypothetical protein
LRELRRCGPHVYLKLEDAGEVGLFTVRGEMDDFSPPGGGFEFFRGLGIIGYANTFKIWLRKFPRPIFIVCAENNQIISWVFIEEWPEMARDGSPVWVLRAIETLPSFRKRKIGYRLLLLGLSQTVGYLITKPLTADADRFFRRSGFMDEREFRSMPMDLSKHPGYLMLPPFRKTKLMTEIDKYFIPAGSPEA